MTVSELECDTPRPVYMDSIARRLKTPQRMELRPSEVHVLGTPGLIETVQQAKDAILQASVNPTRPTFAPKLGQGFMLEGPYHTANVVETATSVN